MEIRIVLMSVLITNIMSKKYSSLSDESIENLLYFKDCQHDNPAPTTTSPPIARLSQPVKPTAMECPFPKMCCALTCGGNECGNSSPFMGRQNPTNQMQMEPNFPPMALNSPYNSVPFNNESPKQPQRPPQVMKGKKKKGKPPMRSMQPPIGTRRNFGFTKDKIKSLINQDEDIRKILKDLVKVTMKKVDLVDMISNRKPALGVSPLNTRKISDDDNVDYNDETYNEDDEDLE